MIPSRFAYFLLPLALCLSSPRTQAQDSVKLPEVTIQAYFNRTPVFRSSMATVVIDSTQLDRHSGISFLPVFNTVAGVRMEERSPGSYRLSIRGSLLRSPFGIRNIKIYLDEFPLTDGGGNTYLNLIDPQAIKNIEVLKGPDGSSFGANSGGVVRLGLQGSESNQVVAGIKVGSFGLFSERVSVKRTFKKNTLEVSQSWLKSDGYRDNSKLDRKYFQLTDTWRYQPAGAIKVLFLYSDLKYLTPGGLNMNQFNIDPKSARPATATVPGAQDQHAGVSNKTAYAGLQHERQLGSNFKHLIAIFGSSTQFENPFITNFELRKEKTAGVRTWLQYNLPVMGDKIWQITGGLEALQTGATISNFGNRGGFRDTIQAIDKLISSQQTYFLNTSLEIFKGLLVEAAISINFNSYRISRIEPVFLPRQTRNFAGQTMPRIAASYTVNDKLTFRGSVSKGFSPPTLAEIRSSDLRINYELQSEQGWNYETGIRLRNQRRSLLWDISVFQFNLDNAIVRKVNENGQEFFVNAGSTKQPGLESQLEIQLLEDGKSRIFRQVQLSNSITLNDFRFKKYVSGSIDLSGKELTGAPRQTVITGISVLLPARFTLFMQHNYTAKIPLTDQNTSYAGSYRLVQGKISWLASLSEKKQIQTSVGVDNLLNERYSLGNDLNAFGGRFYNAAPTRNYWLSLTLLF